MLIITNEHDPEIQLALKRNKLDFSNVKAVVYSSNIDRVHKRKDGSPVIGERVYCANFMRSLLSFNPYANIQMRDVRLITQDGKVLFGGITR